MAPFLKQCRKIISTADSATKIVTFLICAPLLLTPFVVCEGFADPYTPPKWIVVLLSLTCLLFVWLSYSRQLHLPCLPRGALYGMGGLSIILIFNSFYHSVPFFAYENLRRLMFWLAVWCFFSIFSQTKGSLFPLIQGAIYSSLGLFVSLGLIRYVMDPSSPPSLSIGNANLAAESIVIFLAFPLSHLVRLWREGRNSLFLTLLIAGGVAYLYLTCCRSVYIELSLIFFLILWTTKNSFKGILKLFALLGIVLFSFRYLPPFVTLVLNLSSPSTPFDFHHCLPSSTVLSKSFSFRGKLYLDTLILLANNPLGVGVGQFEFSSLPYFANLCPEQSEYLIFLTPHSEILHYLAEDGAIASLMMAGVAVYLLYCLRKEIVTIFKDHPEFIFLTIIFSGEALVQFPLVEPLPYLIAALMLGRFFALMKRPFLTYPFTPSLKVTLASFNALLLFFLGIHFTSQYIAFSYPEKEHLNRIACSSLTRNWSACLNVASLSLDKGDLTAAKVYASKALEWNPLNHHGMKLLGFTYLYQGELSKACKLFRAYDSLFHNQSSLHEIILAECPPFPSEI